MIVLLLFLHVELFSMKNLLSNVSIQVNKHVYIKDPESSNLGQKIVSGSIDLLEEIGFEAFTFGKLANKIESTEASVYRYFESKHKLLLYLFNWYWAWMEYRIVFGTANIESPEERLKRAIKLMAEEIKEDGNFAHINETKLHQIVICEASKAYLNKNVDKENKEGVFLIYKDVVQRISDIILEINPKYQYPHMLVTTIIEGAHNQRYFAEHLPRLTDVSTEQDAIVDFSTKTILNSIQS